MSITGSKRGSPILGSTPILGSATEFGKLIADDAEQWGSLIRALGIEAE